MIIIVLVLVLGLEGLVLVLGCLVLVLVGLVLVLVLGLECLVLVLEGQVLVNITEKYRSVTDGSRKTLSLFMQLEAHFDLFRPHESSNPNDDAVNY